MVDDQVRHSIADLFSSIHVLSLVSEVPGVPNDAIGGTPQTGFVRRVLIGAAEKLGKVLVSDPSASSLVPMRLLRSEDTVFEMIKSIFPKGCNRT